MCVCLWSSMTADCIVNYRLLARIHINYTFHYVNSLNISSPLLQDLSTAHIQCGEAWEISFVRELWHLLYIYRSVAVVMTIGYIFTFPDC